jgi:geranylgeranyl diphosphate synthase type I
MAQRDFSQLMDAIARRESDVKDYLLQKHPVAIGYPHLQEAALSYVKAGGKSLRPAVLMFACGAVGGDEQKAVPAAAAVELYHTFTLVHDDIIDRDEMRRGVPTVHVDFTRRAQHEFGYDAATAEHYGLAVAILTGDIQQGWAASLLPLLHREFGVSAELALNLVDELFRRVQQILINGETLDILLSQMPVERVTPEQVIDMLWQKTGILYEFCGRAGAAIGLNQPDLHHKDVEALATFTSRCGTAFQIQDDILGVVGDSKSLGKAVGNDIREGKRTLVLIGSLPRMTAAQRKFTLKTAGDRNASDADVQAVIELFRTCGGIDYARGMAQQYMNEGLKALESVPDSEFKALLKLWAEFVIERAR